MSDTSPSPPAPRSGTRPEPRPPARRGRQHFPELRDARAEQERLNNALEDTEITLEGVEKNIRRTELDLSSIREQVGRAREEQEKNAFDARAQSQYGSRIQMLSERADELEEDLARCASSSRP